MKCIRPGCKNEIPPNRRKYCSQECSRMMNRQIANTRAVNEVRQAAQSKFTKMSVRTCLSCSKPFMSEGPWNRICPSCSEKNESYSFRSRKAAVGGSSFDDRDLLE